MPEWSRHASPSGHWFWYNASKGISTYDEPDRARKKLILPTGKWLVATRQGKLFIWDPTRRETRDYKPSDASWDQAILLIARARGLPERLLNHSVEKPGITRHAKPTEPSHHELKKPGKDDKQGYKQNAEDKTEQGNLMSGFPVHMESQQDKKIEPPNQHNLSTATTISFSEESSDDDDEEEFVEMLNDLQPNPSNHWESNRDKLARDPRYLALSSNTKRAQVFNEWAKKQGVKNSTREDYLRLVWSNAQPTLYYLEFKRRFRDKPGFNCDLADKEKEVLYREYQRYIRRSAGDRKRHLNLIKSLRNTEEELESDLRWVAVPPSDKASL